MIWQLIDSAFPAGGFVHSGGLEAAWRHGHVSRGGGLRDFILESLWQSAYGSIPFLLAVHDQPLLFTDVDTQADAFLSNHVANRASRAQGRALMATAFTVFQDLSAQRVTEDVDSADAPPCHLAPAFGYVTAKLGIARQDALQAFLFHTARSLVSSAVRLSIVGPLEGQRIQASLAEDLQRIALAASSFTLLDVAHIAPLQDLFQATQDRLYSRLFQS